MNGKFLPLIIATLLLTNICYKSFAATYYSRASGNWNSSSSWSTSGYSGSAAASCPGSGAGDVVLISGYTVTVTTTPANSIASITISQSNNTGNDTKLYLNTSGITLTCNSLSVSDNNIGDNIDVEIAQGTLQVNGSATFTRSTSNNKDQRLKLYIHSTGRVNITGNLTYTLNRAQNNKSADNEIQLDNTGRLDVIGNLTATIGNNSGNDNEFDFVMNNTSVCNIGGNVSFTVSDSDDGDDMTLDLNGGTFTVSGTFSGTVASSASSSNSLHLYIDGATMSTGALTFTQSGGSNGDMDIKLNSNSTSAIAALTVNGSLTYTHNDGDNMEIENNSNETLTTQNLYVLLSASADGDNIYLDFNGGTVNALNGILTIAGGATSANFLYFDVDGTTVNFAGYLRFVQNGGGGNGDINFFLNANSTSAASTVSVGGNLSFDHSGGDNYEVELNNNSSLTVAGSLMDTLQSSDGDDFLIDINGGTFSVSQNFYHVQASSGGTTEDLNVRVDGSGKFNIGSDIYINQTVGGQVSIYTNSSTGSTAEFNVGGNFVVYHGAAADGVYLETDQSSKFTVGGNFLIDNYASAGDNTRIKMSNSSIFTVTGNLTMNLLSGSTSVADHIQIDMNGGAMSVGGNLTMYSLTGNDAILTLDGNSTSLTVSGILKLQHAGGDNSYITLGKNASGSPTLTVGALTLDDTGGNLTYCRLYNSSVLTVTGNITLSALAASELDMALYNTSQLKIGGSFIRNSTPSRFGVLSCATGSTVEYNGTSQQTIAGDAGSGGDGFTYGGLKLNNAAGFTTAASEGNITIPNGALLTFTNGIANTSSSAYIVIANGASVSGASNSSYVDGPIRKVGNSTFTFPIGDNGNYQPASISAPANAAYHFTAQYFSANPGTSYNSGSLSGIDHISKCEYWYIDRTNGSTNVTITLAFDAGSCGITDLTALRVARWDGTTWQNQGNGGTTGTTSAGTIVNGTTVTTYLTPNSPFTLASSNTSNPLPVEMISFNASAFESIVNVDWSTATERDNDYFEIERSVNSVDFESIGKVKGAGNSNTVKDYKWVDMNPFQNISYYRIKQVDFNGAFTYSDVIAVNLTTQNHGEDIIVYPNPSNGKSLHVEFIRQVITGANKSNVMIQLFDETGKSVFMKTESIAANTEETLELNFNQRLKPGIYLMKFTEGNLSRNKLVMIN